jgi:hypothetical protein
MVVLTGPSPSIAGAPKPPPEQWHAAMDPDVSITIACATDGRRVRSSIVERTGRSSSSGLSA